jgi:AcrR family transcriptional regulator
MEGTDRSTRTRDAILDAAIAEFIEHGFSGVRIEHVAKRAGYNKSLVYRWFRDKETLFDQALTRRFSLRAALLDKAPADLSELLLWWSEQAANDPDFMRMILRESLDAQGKAPAHADYRRNYYRRQIDLLKSFQSSGTVDESFEPDMLFLALLAIVALGTALPQVVVLATGSDPSGPEFKERWAHLLRVLAAHLAGRSGGHPDLRRAIREGASDEA